MTSEWVILACPKDCVLSLEISPAHILMLGWQLRSPPSTDGDFGGIERPGSDAAMNVVVNNVGPDVIYYENRHGTSSRAVPVQFCSVPVAVHHAARHQGEPSRNFRGCSARTERPGALLISPRASETRIAGELLGDGERAANAKHTVGVDKGAATVDDHHADIAQSAPPVAAVYPAGDLAVAP